MQRLSRSIAAGVALATGSALLFFCFARVDVYNHRFFAHGGLIAFYNLARIASAVLLAWLVYASGLSALHLLAGRAAVATLRAGERYALAFFTGAALWLAMLLGLGFMGLDIYPVAIALTLAAAALSGPAAVSSFNEARAGLRAAFARISPHAVRNRWCAAVLAAVASLYVLIKILLPNGSNDYYTHYFYYYIRVIHNGSLMPNEVWYHFFYSKGAGLYFLLMVLTDPLAPQLVAAGFIAAAGLALAMQLDDTAPGSVLGWIGVILFFGFLIFTPSPPDLVGAAGWAEPAKIHELTAATFFAVFWTSIRLIGEGNNRGGRCPWIIGLAAATTASVLLTTVMAAVVGAYLLLLGLGDLLMRRKTFVWPVLGCALLAAVIGLAMMGLNYLLTGIPLDQLLLQTWPIVDLEKVQHWGVLMELLWLHYGMTGFMRQAEPFGWHLMRMLSQDLRLDLWWPLIVFGGCGFAHAVMTRQRLARAGSPKTVALWIGGAAFLLSFLLVALGAGAARTQPLSFFRFSSFAYGPVLALCLALCWAFPLRARSLVSAAIMAVAFGIAAGQAGKHGRMMAVGMPMLTGNALAFATGQFSIADAYRHPGWPSRDSWGGIYPGMEQAWRIVGRDTPIYTLHLQAYCMLPDCRVLGWMSERATRDTADVLFGTPDQAAAAFKSAGINYFFYSRELGAGPSPIATPLVFSPVLAPDTIALYLGIKWTDGRSFLLTWRDSSERPLDADFLATYRQQVGASPFVQSFPLATMRGIFMHFREYGLHPYPLPWSK